MEPRLTLPFSAPQTERIFDTLRALHRPIEGALRYHDAVLRWVLSLAPNASIELQIAAFSQHLGRHERPRKGHPEGRAGYLAWRKEASLHCGARSRAVLTELGLPEAFCDHVASLVAKRPLPDRFAEEAITLEDAVCLTFIELDYPRMAAAEGPEKMMTIVEKTLRKMSPRGREEALRLERDRESEPPVSRGR